MGFYKQLAETKWKQNIESMYESRYIKILVVDQAGLMSGSKTLGQTFRPKRYQMIQDTLARQ